MCSSLNSITKEVVVVGGGITGLCSAYFLNQQGAQVTVVDAGNLEDSASCGNAGFLSMFEKSPFAYPGVFQDTLRAFLKKRSPMTVTNPFSIELARWGLEFFRASRKKKFERGCALFQHFGEDVFEFYDTLTNVEGIDCEYRRGGFALVYIDEKNYRKKLQEVQAQSEHYEVLTRERIEELFPFVRIDRIAGGVVLKRNGHLNPGKVISGLKSHLERQGVRFLLGERVMRAVTNGNQVKAVQLPSQELTADEYVMATGADLGLARQLRKKLTITPGRGYSVTFQMEESLKPRMPALFCDVYTAISTRRDDVRITGKIEFGGGRAKPEERVASLVENFKKYTTDFQLEKPELWSGVRPLTGDDLPYIGRDAEYRNFIYATGLGHLGMNLGPIVGSVVGELISSDQENSENSRLLLLSGFYQS